MYSKEKTSIMASMYPIIMEQLIGRKPLQMVWNTPLSGLATAAGDPAQL